MTIGLPDAALPDAWGEVPVATAAGDEPGVVAFDGPEDPPLLQPASNVAATADRATDIDCTRLRCLAFTSAPKWLVLTGRRISNQVLGRAVPRALSNRHNRLQ